jgi:hypothetical protein
MQSKYGRRGCDLGGSTTVDLALSTCAFSKPDKFSDSNASIPLPSMLLKRGCKGIGWEGVWEICPRPEVLIGTMGLWCHKDVVMVVR